MNLRFPKIQTQLKLGLFTLIMFVAGIGFVFLREMAKLAQQTEIMYNHPLKVRKAVGLIRTDLLLYNNKIKTLIVESEKLRTDFPKNQLDQLDSNVNRQVNILHDRYLGPQTTIDSLEQSIILLISIRKTIILHAQQLNTTKSDTIIADFNKEENQLNVVLGNLQGIYNFAERTSYKLYEESMRVSNLANIHIMLLLAVVLLLSSFISFILWRNIKIPLEELKRAAKNFGDGHFNARSSYRSMNEFGELSASFNDMADAININIDEKEKQANKLMAANKELEFRINEISQYSYITNHDLREPLSAMTHFTQLLQENYAGKFDEDGNKYIEFIHNSARRMNDLMKGLFEYSSIGQERVKRIIDCNKIVGDVLSYLDDSIKGCDARITVQELPTFDGYESELRLLFQNLIENAIKYQIKGMAPEINISAESREKDWIFSIKDNGVGIDKKHFDKIFLIFQRLHNRTEYEGTGIGLAHCKKIVELHGGKIWVESNIEGGSTFKFTIPIPNA